MTRDLRKYASQTNVQLVIGAAVLLLTVGLGLIWYFYGLSGALMGLLCLLGFSVPIGLIWFFLFGLDKLVKRMDRD